MGACVIPVTVLSHFSFTELFNLHNNHMREEVSNSYYSFRKEGSERLRNLSRVTQLTDPGRQISVTSEQ